MVDLYTCLIYKGAKTIDSVPAYQKAAVLAMLEVIGLDGYGKPIDVL